MDVIEPAPRIISAPSMNPSPDVFDADAEAKPTATAINDCMYQRTCLSVGFHQGEAWVYLAPGVDPLEALLRGYRP